MSWNQPARKIQAGPNCAEGVKLRSTPKLSRALRRQLQRIEALGHADAQLAAGEPEIGSHILAKPRCAIEGAPRVIDD